MEFYRTQEGENEKYTWFYKIKYTFYVSVLFIICLLFYSFIYDFYIRPINTESDIFSVITGNFIFKNYKSTMLPGVIFYILLEEFVFRKPLIINFTNVAVSLILLFILCFKSFLNEDLSLFFYGFYAILLIILLRKKYISSKEKRLNLFLSLFALSFFHSSKFTTPGTDFFDLSLSNIIPFFIVSIFLAHLRVKFNSLASLSSYLILIIFAYLLRYIFTQQYLSFSI